MPVGGPDDPSDVGQPGAGRATAYWGVAFVLLLLLSAGMVTVPGADRGASFVRDFYEANRTVIVLAQAIGLVAAVAFLPFARGLQRQSWVGRRPWVFVFGAAVSVAAVLAAVPPLLLCVVAPAAGSGTLDALATASDRVDVVLFATISAFAVAVAVAVDTTWVRALSAIVALTTAVRGLFSLTGQEPLELVAPMAFIVLVVSLAIASWRSQRSADS
jgi:hypothetical protein